MDKLKTTGKVHSMSLIDLCDKRYSEKTKQAVQMNACAFNICCLFKEVRLGIHSVCGLWFVVSKAATNLWVSSGLHMTTKMTLSAITL